MCKAKHTDLGLDVILSSSHHLPHTHYPHDVLKTLNANGMFIPELWKRIINLYILNRAKLKMMEIGLCHPPLQ